MRKREFILPLSEVIWEGKIITINGITYKIGRILSVSAKQAKNGYYEIECTAQIVR
jgi:hypothetical protein